jgi:integrase
VLLAFQDIPGAEITSSEAAVLKGSGLPLRTVTDVLAAAGMLRDDRAPAVETWFIRHTADLPGQMRAELRTWFEVMAYGSRTPPRRLPRTHATIRLQLSFALPALHAWAEAGHQSLREISRADVIAILPTARNPRALMGQGLRSVFRLLKARKVIFTNPTARIPIGYPAPREPLPADVAALRQALDSADPAQAALTALVAFCGLRSGQLRALLLTDLRDGRLHIGGRAVVLAAAVQQRLAAYLGYRTSRWPHTANPHLFVSQRTATRTGPVGNRWIKLKIGIAGATQAIREDRILDEAHATGGDARRLCDLFGLSMTAAERYIATVSRPDLTGKANAGA